MTEHTSVCKGENHSFLQKGVLYSNRCIAVCACKADKINEQIMKELNITKHNQASDSVWAERYEHYLRIEKPNEFKDLDDLFPNEIQYVHFEYDKPLKYVKKFNTYKKCHSN